MRTRKKGIFVLSVLFCLLVFMGIGFAALSTTLNIGGTATAINTWDVRIINITPIENSTGAKSSKKEIATVGTEATFSTTFRAPGDYIEYDVEVRNGGSLDATLYSLVITPSGDDIDLFEISHNSEQGSKLYAGQSLTLRVKIMYKLNSTRLPNGETTFNLSINYGQGDAIEGGGNTPGGGSQPDKNWDFEVDNEGTIIAYNYALGTDVVIPATNYEGKPIKAITAQSFKGSSNSYPEVPVDVYIESESGVIFVVINSTDPYYTLVKNKIIQFVENECNNNSNETEVAACKQQISENVKIYSASSYNQILPEYNTTVFVESDPNILWYNSIKETSDILNFSYVKVNAYINYSTGELLGIINAESPYFDFAKRKLIQYLKNDCEQNYSSKEAILQCKQALTSVKFLNSETSLQDGYSDYMTVYVLTDPAVSWYSSFRETLNQTKNSNEFKSYSLKLLNGYINTKSSVVRLSDSETEKLTSIDFSKAVNLELIGVNSFSNFEITSIEFGSNSKIKTIGSKAFLGNKIHTLVLPESVIKLGDLAFASNPLTNLTVEKCSVDVCKIGAFGNEVKSVIINAGEIGEAAFSTSLVEKVKIGSGVTEIGALSFATVNLLLINDSTIVILDDENFNLIKTTLTNLVEGNYNFLRLNQVNISEIMKNSFFAIYFDVSTHQISSGMSFVEELNLDDAVSLRKIGAYSFYAGKINELSLPDSVIEINEYAFYKNQINKLILSKEVTKIGNSAFEYNQINSLYVPKTLVSIGEKSFSNNIIETLIIEKCNLTICKSNSSELNKFGNFIKQLEIKSGEVGEYSFYSADNSSLKLQTLILGEKVTSIGKYAFANNQISGELKLPEGITSIGESAFANNQISGELKLPEGITSIGASTFVNNQISGELKFPEGITSIGASAFSNNQISGELKLPEGITSIGSSAFAYNQISGELMIPSSITFISSNLFYANQISGELVIHDDIYEVDQGAFEYNQISKLTLGKGLKRIGHFAFMYNQINELNYYISNESVYLGSMLFQQNLIEKLVIDKCNLNLCWGNNGSSGGNYYFGNRIKELEIKSGKIGEYSFYSSSESTTKIEKITLGENVTEIKRYAFGNNLITELNIPKSVTSIEGCAFENNLITELTIPDNVKYIGGYAFEYNPISSIIIQRSEADFLANVTVGNYWYGAKSKPTITYLPS